jgi:hypothetical protein
MSRYAHRIGAIQAVIARINPKSDNGFNQNDGNDYARSMEATCNPLKDSVSAIVRLHSSPNPTENANAHYKRVANASKHLEKQRLSVFDELQNIYRQGVLDNEAKIGKKINLKPDDKYGAELRAVYRAASPAERAEMLSGAIAANDGPVLAAIIEVPAVLTGIEPELQKTLRHQIISLHAAGEMAQLQALNDAFDVAINATDVAKLTASDFSDPVRLAEIERAESAANAATAAFTKAAGASNAGI